MIVRFIILFISCVLLFACQSDQKSIQVTVSSNDGMTSISENDSNILKGRLTELTNSSISVKEEDGIIMFTIPEYKDTSAVRQVLERSRMLKLFHSIPPKEIDQMKVYLAKYDVEQPTIDKPYKSKSTVGLLPISKKREFEKILFSPDFEEKFSDSLSIYYGAQQMENKLAIFMGEESQNYIDENMFTKVSRYQGENPEEGIFYLELKEEFADRLGPLTGNDSTYLLHVLDNEVYISKIIEPYIEGPIFSMSGVFTPQEVEIFSALWNSEDLETPVQVRHIEIIQ